MMKTLNQWASKLMLAATFAIASLATMVPQPADAGISFATTVRTSMMDAIVTAAGATGAKIKE